MKFLTAMAWALLLLAAPALADAPPSHEDPPQKCWLAQEVKRGAFTLKFFLTEKNEKLVEAENLQARHPDGQPTHPVGLSESTRRRFFTEAPQPVYLEVWHTNRLLYVVNTVGSFENFAGLEKILMRQLDYPSKGVITYALYLNTQGTAALTGVNLMLSISPKEERFTAYKTTCHYDILYERVAGGQPDDEFERVKALEEPLRRHVCDPSLDYYGGLGQGGLPRPVRLIVFDERDKHWRADRPGEFPVFYWNQVPMTLDYSGVTIATEPLEQGGRAQAEKSGRALMAEIMANKTEFITKTKLDLAFVAYSLIMMGLPEKEVREFFLTMAGEYTRVKGSFNWGVPPEKAFDDLAAAAKDFQPLERDETFRFR